MTTFPTVGELRRIGVIRSYLSQEENDRRVAGFAVEFARDNPANAAAVAELRDTRRAALGRVMLGLAGSVVLAVGILASMAGNDGRALPPASIPAPPPAEVPAEPQAPPVPGFLPDAKVRRT